MFNLENVAVQICYPLPPFERQIQVRHRIRDNWRNLAPIETWISVGDVSRALVAKPSVTTDFLELMKERVELARVKRVCKLSNQIRGSHEAGLSIRLAMVVIVWNGKPRQFNRSCQPVGIDQRM